MRAEDILSSAQQLATDARICSNGKDAPEEGDEDAEEGMGIAPSHPADAREVRHAGQLSMPSIHLGRITRPR